jgi:hypothetical protein
MCVCLSLGVCLSLLVPLLCDLLTGGEMGLVCGVEVGLSGRELLRWMGARRLTLSSELVLVLLLAEKALVCLRLGLLGEELLLRRDVRSDGERSAGGARQKNAGHSRDAGTHDNPPRR